MAFENWGIYVQLIRIYNMIIVRFYSIFGDLNV